MLKNIILITVMLSLILATGCVSKAQFDEQLRQQQNLAADLARTNSEIQAQQQTLAALTLENSLLQSELVKVKSQLDLEKQSCSESAQQMQASRDNLTAYRKQVAETYKTLESNYNNFVAKRASSATTLNLMTGEPIPSTDPVLSATDTELLAIWRTALIKISQLIVAD